MDPLTHSFLGMATAMVLAPRQIPKGHAALAGLAAGLLPDSDVFLRNSADPLFFIEYHRHFTHSLAFSPVIAALAIGIVWLILRAGLRKPVQLAPLFVPALVAGWSHIFCDLWTSYGTRVWWPFSNARASLDWVAVVDPLLTLPMIALLVAGFIHKTPAATRRYAALSLTWVALYLSAAVVQQRRAESTITQWLASKNVSSARPPRLALKPSFANIVVWRAMLHDDDGVRVLAVRCGLGPTQLLTPNPVRHPAFDSANSAIASLGLPEDSQQASDIRRFFHFSDDWVGVHPQHPDVLGDLRYASLPDDVRPLWGIRISPGAPQARVEWRHFTDMEPGALSRLWDMISGKSRAHVVHGGDQRK